MSIAYRIAGGLVGVGAITVAMTGPASAGGWVETPTGQVSIQSVAQPAPGVTWAAGPEVTTDPVDGSTHFTPALYQRDTAKGPGWRKVPLPVDGWDSRVNDMATTADGTGFLVGDMDPGDPGVLVGRHTSGGWQISADTVLPAGAVDASLLSVSARSGHDAWAVGSADVDDGSAYTSVPLVQHWNGRAWQSVRIPGSADWGLYQVDEVAPDDVWVVGVDYDSGQALIVHWDGRQWTRTPAPAFPDSANLFDVAARGPSDVWAVGWYRDTDKQRPLGLALHWDGRSWTQVPLPDGTFALNAVALQPHGGIAAVGGNDDAAVGLSWTPSAGWQSLGLPANDPTLPLGVSCVVASGTHLTVGGWHYESSDSGDTFSSGSILTN